MSHFPERDGQVLLVVDVQNDVMAECRNVRPVVRRIADLVGRARLAGTPVVWVRHQDDFLVPDTDGWQVVPELPPEPGEAFVDKRYGDSFADTALDDVLGGLGVGKVVLVGAQSDYCIRSTFFGGLYRGYDMTLVTDAHTTADDDYGPTDFSAARLVAVVNKLAATTSLPGVRAATTTAAEVDLSASQPDDAELLEQVEADEQAEEDADDVELGLADPES